MSKRLFDFCASLAGLLLISPILFMVGGLIKWESEGPIFYHELARVLKLSGKIICNEPLAYNPIINMYRKMTPHLRTPWEAEHILTLREVRKAKRYFRDLNIKYFHLASILSVPFRNSPIFEAILAPLEFIDSIVLKIPYVQMLAWQIVFILSDPKT